MAPLTRNRANPDGTPSALQAEHYGQRAGAGVIIAEGTQPSAVGQGYPNTPGLHTDAQQEGWRRIAEAVHARGGRIVVQLMHAGRISRSPPPAVPAWSPAKAAHSATAKPSKTCKEVQYETTSLSYESPTEPIDGRIPWSCKRCEKRKLV